MSLQGAVYTLIFEIVQFIPTASQNVQINVVDIIFEVYYIFAFFKAFLVLNNSKK